MEPSQVEGALGEFSGSDESGWTAYIGELSVDTPEYGNNHKGNYGNDDDDDDDDGDDDGDDDDDDDGEESDDSMASDASSGPSHLQLLGINCEGSHGSYQLKHADNNVHRRAVNQARKGRYGSKVEEEEEEEEELAAEADSASSHV